jgi:hypothetical protein
MTHFSPSLNLSVSAPHNENAKSPARNSIRSPASDWQQSRLRPLVEQLATPRNRDG